MTIQENEELRDWLRSFEHKFYISSVEELPGIWFAISYLYEPDAVKDSILHLIFSTYRVKGVWE